MSFWLTFLMLSIGIQSYFFSDDTAKQQYIAILKKYEESFSFDLTYDMSISSDGNETNEIKNCRYIKNGSAYLSTIDNITVIGNHPYVLQLDATNKTMHVSNYETLPSIFSIPGIQVLLKQPNLFTLTKESDLIHRIDIQTGDFNLNAISITFNPLNNEIIEYKTKHQEEIAYGELQIISSIYTSTYTKQIYSSDSLRINDLSLSNYFKATEFGKFIPVGKYSKWSLVQLTKN